MNTMVGQVFLGRYEAIRQIGEGGMGKVYLARHRERDDPVVIKVMHPHLAANPESRQRFHQEMRLMARFTHPHAVVVQDASMEDAQGPCIVMEYLPGVTLDRLLQANVRFTPTRVYRFVHQLSDVLQAAHELGIIHRDLKPANLMVLDGDTPQERLKVMDFGIAHLIEPVEAERIEDTYRPQYGVGTPGYMSPEQVRGEPLDPRSDLYSLGVIVYQLLTGRLPYVGATAMEIMIEQATTPPPTFAELGVHEEMATLVEPVIRSALAQDREARPASALAFFEAYEKALTDRKKKAPAPETDAAAATPANAIVAQFTTTMTQQVANYKLKTFIQDVRGKVQESTPGYLRIQLKVHPSALQTAGHRDFLGWLGLRAGLVRMELRMRTSNEKNRSLLHVAASLRPENDQPLPTNEQWQDTCKIILNALKQCLMAQSS